MGSDTMVAPRASEVGREIMDSPDADGVLVTEMLGDITRTNRWFGGRHALRVGMRQLLGDAAWPAQLTLLDLGTGAGDLPLAAAVDGTHHGSRCRPVGLERHRAAARLATANGLPTVVACGTCTPFAADSFDVVLLAQLLHHLDDRSAVRMLVEAGRVARLGVVVADLRPSRLAGWSLRAAGWAMRLRTETVQDGVTSLARGRTGTELGALITRAGGRQPAVAHLPFARVVATWRVGAA